MVHINVELAISNYVSHIEEIKSDVGKLKDLDFEETKKKIRIRDFLSMTDIRSSKYGWSHMDGWLSNLYEKGIAGMTKELKEEEKKMNVKYKQSLRAFKESTGPPMPLDHLKEGDLPREISQIGNMLIRNARNIDKGLQKYIYNRIFKIAGVCFEDESLHHEFERLISIYIGSLEGVFQNARHVLNTEIDPEEGNIKGQIKSLLTSHIEHIKKEFPLDDHINPYSRSIRRKLSEKKEVYEMRLGEVKEIIEEFEKKSGMPRPKKRIIRWRTYKKELEEWEDKMGKSRLNFEALILEYIYYFIKLRELKIQWIELREYITNLFGSKTDLAKFKL